MLIGLALTFFSLSVYFGKKGLKTLIDNNQLPLIILSIFGLIIAWNFRAFMSKSSAEAMVGLSFHFFGASLLVVMFGLWEAIALLFITSLFAVLLVTADIQETATHFLQVGVLPAFISACIISIINRNLPKHLFVFILGRGYVAGLASTLISGLLIATYYAFTNDTPFGGKDPAGWFVGLLVLSFTEGSLSGMLIAIFTIYKPQWVSTYSSKSYMGIDL